MNKETAFWTSHKDENIIEIDENNAILIFFTFK